MSKVKSKGNKSIELKLIEYFKQKCIVGWRSHDFVKGHPDFIFLMKKVTKLREAAMLDVMHSLTDA